MKSRGERTEGPSTAGRDLLAAGVPHSGFEDQHLEGADHHHFQLTLKSPPPHAHVRRPSSATRYSFINSEAYRDPDRDLSK